MDAYSTHLYVEWEQRVGAVATDKLKQPILCSLAASRGLLENTLDSTIPGKAKASVQHQAAGAAPADSKNSGMPPPPYGVNFALELHMIIRESKYLDRMGFQVSVPPYCHYCHYCQYVALCCIMLHSSITVLQYYSVPGTFQQPYGPIGGRVQ